MTFLAGSLRSGRLIILFVGSFLLCNCSDDDPVAKKEDLRADLLAAINELRANGCQCADDFMPAVNALTWNDTLEASAHSHVVDMYKNGFFSHLSPDGTPPIGRAITAGYEGEYVGENIARGYTSIRDVVNGWKESELHCKAMMDTLYNEMGASRAGNYWVLDFGRSK
jgi:uncharacterized protein YkwD